MKMNTNASVKKVAAVVATLILLTGCSSAQKQLPQTVEGVPSAEMTVLQRDAPPE